MTATPDNPPALPQPSPNEPWMRPATLRQLALLGELAEIGLEISRAIERHATGKAEAPVMKGDHALAYARVSRSVRQTIHLQSRLIDSMKAEDDAAAETAPEAAKEAARLTPEYQRKASVERIVERLIEVEHPDDEETLDALICDAGERLDDEDLYGDLMDRPMSELVARICRDLGLTPDWSTLAAELWAQKEIESGTPGWPLAMLTRPLPLAGEGDREAVERAFRRNTGNTG
jgi:hypothetical protein